MTKVKKLPLNPLTVGNTVFIRTVTMAHLGKIVKLQGDMVILRQASWVADTGSRVGEFLRHGTLSGTTEIEVAPGTVCIGRGGIIDVYHWVHVLPIESR